MSITESFRRRIADAEMVLPLVDDTPPQVRIRLDFLKEMLDEIDAEHERRMEQAIAATLGAGTCEADETDLIPFVRADSGDFEVDYIHVMECTECGHTYEHVNGDYEYCPRCGRKRKDVDA